MKIQSSQQDLESFEERMKAGRSNSQQKDSKTNNVGIRLVSNNQSNLPINDSTYLTILKEIDTQKVDFEFKIDKIKKFLELLEVRYFEQNKELLMKLFIHEVSCMKNIEYDLNLIIDVL